MAEENELWIHQESAVISAESHDIWRFTPDFLVSSETVPDNWICTRSTQSSEEVTIQIGPSRWFMTPTTLWITTHPNRPLKDDNSDIESPLVPILTNNFLVSPAILAVSEAVVILADFGHRSRPRPMEAEYLFAKNWPAELGSLEIQPRLVVSNGDLTISVTIRDDNPRRRGADPKESVTFDCYISRPLDQTPDEMLSDITHRTERLLIVERILRQFLAEGS